MEIESLDELKARVKKLSARAMNLKMELHDLSEELPLGWEKIPEVAGRAHESFEALTALRARIAALEG
ncbi:MAG TPA: CCE_0567 family metalloprotein [Rhodocyclaceae bacterium]|nr:CCE_0567 family metalloprotein [Rhodocyclaceae bacterium]